MKLTLGPQILSLRAQGLTYSAIAAKLGCSKGTVAYHVGDGQKAKTIRRNTNGKYIVRDFIISQKTKPCTDCSKEYPYYVMQFDHRPDETKSFTISHITRKARSNLSLDMVATEIAKCDVVCANCHAIRTWLRQQS